MKDIKDFLSSAFNKVTAKKILLYSLAVILIILPISIASIIISVSSEANQADATISVTLKDSSGNVLASDSVSSKESNSESLAFIINKLNERKTKVASLPVFEEEITPLYATIDFKGQTTELECYFPISGKDAYCTDRDKNIYLINDIDSTNFLISEFSESLYPSSKSPELITIDGESVAPMSLSWNYKNIQGAFTPASEAKLGEEGSLYNITGQINLSFSIAPDVCQATAYNEDGKKIFDGMLEDLQNIIVDTEESVRVTVEATWKKNDKAQYHGNAFYDFNVKIENSSDFSVSSTNLSKGGFVVLEATNITDVSKIKFESKQINTKPHFISSGNNTAIAILPYTSEFDQNINEISFSISYRASMETFTLTLSKAQTVHTHKANIARPKNSSIFSSSATAEFQELLKSIGKANKDDIYCNGDFINPTDAGFEQGIYYNSKITYLNEKSPALTTQGCEFIAKGYGISVPVLDSGMVVNVGYCDFLGNFVVVEHGMGLKTWYCHLSDVDVAEGSLVIKGQSVGKTSTSAISNSEGFWLYLTVEDKILNPHSIIK